MQREGIYRAYLTGIKFWAQEPSATLNVLDAHTICHAPLPVLYSEEQPEDMWRKFIEDLRRIVSAGLNIEGVSTDQDS